MVKDYLEFYLNGKKVEYPISKLKGFTLLDFLRENLKFTGTKKGCSEGDCGACTVVIGEFSPLKEKVVYNTVTSCIYPVFKVDGKHVITIEGLGENGALHPIQESFLEHHAVQCGFCTSGIIMSFFGLLLNNQSPSQNEILKALSGNLCRCTGYKAIRESCFDLSKRTFKKPGFLTEIEGKLKENSEDLEFKNLPEIFPFKRYLIPSNLKSALKIISESNDFKILNGSSDFFVYLNRELNSPETLIDISKIAELKFIKNENGILRFGGNITFSELIDYFREKKFNRNFIDIFEIVGSGQIRNSGTPSGNISNASPIADGAVFLLSLDAILTLKNFRGERKVYLRDFYKGYKDTVLNSDEIISEIEFNIPNGEISYLKTSKRKEVDIASVNSCLFLNFKGSNILDLRVSFGGVYPYPVRIFRGEDFIKGKELNLENILKLAEICQDEVKPISDVRGSDKFRKQLVFNHILKHFYDLFPALLGESYEK